jgi:hypothetical protein
MKLILLKKQKTELENYNRHATHRKIIKKVIAILLWIIEVTIMTPLEYNQFPKKEVDY